MKTEDIDKRINMPDVDEEWARFEKEVIGKKTNSIKKIWLGGISIAASIILVTGIFLLGLGNKETKQILSEVEQSVTRMQTSDNQPVEPRTELTKTEASRSSQTEKKEYTKADQFEELAFVSVDKPLQGQIAGMLLAYSDYDDMGYGPYPPEYYDFYEDELQGQIAGLPSVPVSDIRLVKNRRRPINIQTQDTILFVVNGKEDKEFLQYLREMPYWSYSFAYDYFFQRNQVFLREKFSKGTEIENYAPLFNGRKIRRVFDFLTLPYKPVSQFTSKELEARRLAYLLRCYQEGKNSQNYGGMLAPDLFDTPAKERLFGLLSAKHHAIKGECFGHVSSDSRGTFIPLTRYACIKVIDEIWQENGEWVGMEDDPLFNAVIKELDQTANEASSSMVERGDSIVKMAFIYGGKVTKGAPHESELRDRTLSQKVKESTFEFKPDEDAPSYWSAEIYYSTHFPRHMDVHLRSVDKLYATDCPDILNIRYKRLTGVVQDEEGKPLSISSIGYQDRPYFSSGVGTDSLGRFELTLPNSIDTIRVMSIGYQTQKIHVPPTDSVLTIRLKETDWKGLRESFKKGK